MLLVDAAARVVFANRAAEMMFTEGNGLRIDVDGLHAASPAATATLRKLIAECALDDEDPKGSFGAIALSRGTGRIPLNGLVIHLRATTGWLHFNRPTSIIFITDPERQHIVREAQVRRQFDLTKAETAFVVEILRGEGLQASADRPGISLSTARTHLSHAFDKTGTNRQAIARLDQPPATARTHLRHVFVKTGTQRQAGLVGLASLGQAMLREDA